jgi:hypothetical protein
MLDILEVIKNTESIYSTNTALSTLKDFERVLDEMDMYAYENWESGELCSGPHVDRHWVKASFMWPHENMPDPMGGKRLLDYGCRVKYEKTFLVEPREIKTPEDLRPGTKKARLDRKPIWIVEIVMPKKLCADIYNGYMSKMKENMGIGRTEGTQAAPAEMADNMGAAMQPAATPAGGAAPAASVAPVGGVPSV